LINKSKIKNHLLRNQRQKREILFSHYKKCNTKGCIGRREARILSWEGEALRILSEDVV